MSSVFAPCISVAARWWFGTDDHLCIVILFSSKVAWIVGSNYTDNQIDHCCAAVPPLEFVFPYLFNVTVTIHHRRDEQTYKAPQM
jgi:hypothetical protein